MDASGCLIIKKDQTRQWAGSRDRKSVHKHWHTLCEWGMAEELESNNIHKLIITSILVMFGSIQLIFMVIILTISILERNNIHIGSIQSCVCFFPGDVWTSGQAVDFNAAWNFLFHPTHLSSEILLPSHRKHQFDVVSLSPTRKT